MVNNSLYLNKNGVFYRVFDTEASYKKLNFERKYVINFEQKVECCNWVKTGTDNNFFIVNLQEVSV